MTVSVKKWGNSLAVRLPRDLARSLSIDNGSRVEMYIEDGSLIIEPAENDELAKLIEGITPDNLHGEIETGKAVGHEEW